MSETRSPAVLFDIDGTLIDSNYLHVQAWAEAFESMKLPVDTWRIHRSIGMDSSKLLTALLGDQAEALGAKAKRRHDKRMAKLVPRLRRFDGVPELLAALRDRGFQVVLATSAPEQELKHLRAELDVEALLAAVTSGDDVETAKPEPDIVDAALEQAGVSADRAVMIGDSVWDAQAAARAGVGFVGVRSGGVSDGELRAAGALAVYDDPRDLLQHLADSPIGRLV